MPTPTRTPSRQYRRTFACLALIALLSALTALWATPAQAQVNPNPIDWTIISDYYDVEGNKIPLRLGQSDAGQIPGFGQRHITEKHGEVPPDWEIQETLATACGVLDIDDKIRCYNDETLLFLVYKPTSDPRSGDNQPLGIITAFRVLPPCLPDGTAFTIQQARGPEADETGIAYTGTETAQNGEPLEVSASLVEYPLGSPLPERELTFTFGSGGQEQTCTGTTGNDGIAACTIDSVNQPPGAIALRITFAGEEGFLPSTATAQLGVRSPTATEYTGDTQTANGESAAMSAGLTDAHYNAPLPGQPVTFTLGDTAPQTCTATTDTNGVAACTIDLVDQPLTDAATVPVTAAFTGTDTYLASGDDATVLLEYYTGRAFGISADLTLPLLPPIGLPDQPDTGTIRAAAPTETDTPCAATVTALVIEADGLCPDVAITLDPGTVTAQSPVEQVAIGLPGIADIAIEGLTATAVSTCDGATGQTEVTLRINGETIAIGEGTDIAIELPGGAAIVINEQQSTEDGTGIAVTGVRITAPGLADIHLAHAHSAAHHCASALP